MRQMSARQFLDWFEYDKVEPIGGKRGDWQAASICTAIMNAASAQMRSSKRFRVSEFLLEFDKKKDVTPEPTAAPICQTWQEQKMIGMMWAASFNAGENKKRRHRG